MMSRDAEAVDFNATSASALPLPLPPKGILLVAIPPTNAEAADLASRFRIPDDEGEIQSLLMFNHKLLSPKTTSHSPCMYHTQCKFFGDDGTIDHQPLQWLYTISF